MVDKDAVRHGYDEVAETYAAERSTEGPGLDLLAEVLDFCGESPRVLDAGCGEGTPVLRRVSTEAAAVGIDFSREQLRRAVDVAPPASLVQGDMVALPFSDGAFDVVTAFHSLIHIPIEQHQAVIDEFARVLRPGGRVLVTEGTGEWSGTNPDWLDTGVEMQWHIAGADATREQLVDAGFTITNEWTVSETLDGDEEWVFLSGRQDR